MMNRRNLLRGLTASAAAVTLLGARATNAPATPAAAGASPAPAAGEPIRIGQSAVFSGPSANSGTDLKVGVEACFNQVNQKGGINGRPLQLIALDDGYEPERCAANTKKLVDQEKVVALVGYFGTATSAAALPILSAAKVPFVGAYTGAGVLRTNPPLPTVFNVRASYEDEGLTLVKQLLSIQRNRIAIFYQDDGYGIAVKEAVERGLANAGLKAVAVGAVPRNSVDVAKALEIIGASDCNAVVLACLYAPGAAFVKAMNTKKVAMQYASTSAIGTVSFIEALGPTSRGTLVTQVMPYPFKSSGRLAVQRDYHDAMQAIGNESFNYGTMEGYIDARVLVEGLRHAGATINRQTVQAGLESIGTMDLGGFAIGYAPQNHNASSFVEMTVLGAGGTILR